MAEELKVGMMTKRAQGISTIGSINYKERVFVLTRQKLSYYDGTIQQRGKIKGSFRLDTITFVGPVSDQALNRTSTFQIIHGGYYLYCCAKGEADRDEWIQAIKQACAHSLEVAYHPSIYQSGKWQCCGKTSRNEKGCKRNENGGAGIAPSIDQSLRDMHLPPIPIDPGRRYSIGSPVCAPVIPPKSPALLENTWPSPNQRPSIAETVNNNFLPNGIQSAAWHNTSDISQPANQRYAQENSQSKSHSLSGAFRHGYQETEQPFLSQQPSQSYNKNYHNDRFFNQDCEQKGFTDKEELHTNSYPQTHHSCGEPPPPPQYDYEDKKEENYVVALYKFEPVESDDIALQVDERYKVLDTSRLYWWKVRDKHGNEGYVPSNYVSENKNNFESQCWFQKDISRQRAEYLLKQDGKEGSFIVRNSSQPSCIYTLSVVSKIGCVTGPVLVKHYHIKLNEQGKYYLSEKHSMSSVMELIEYHKLNAGGLVTRLRQAPLSLRGMDQPSTHLFSDSRWEIDINEIEFMKELGSGQFGVVRLARIRGRQLVAIKIMKENAMEEDQFIEEAEVMTRLQHKNLVGLYGVVTKQTPICIVTEFMEEGCLLDYMRKNTHLQTHPDVLLEMCYQVCDAMKYLEDNSMIHRDLAARNCLVGKKMVIKVADFGLTRYVLDDEYTSSLGSKFPIKWAAPEVLNYTKFSSKSDVWAYGILMWELFTGGKMPYRALSNSDVVDQVANGHRLERPSNCPHEVYQVMCRCWEMQPENRPSFGDLFRNFDDLVDTVNATCLPEGTYDA